RTTPPRAAGSPPPQGRRGLGSPRQPIRPPLPSASDRQRSRACLDVAHDRLEPGVDLDDLGAVGLEDVALVGLAHDQILATFDVRVRAALDDGVAEDALR